MAHPTNEPETACRGRGPYETRDPVQDLPKHKHRPRSAAAGSRLSREARSAGTRTAYDVGGHMSENKLHEPIPRGARAGALLKNDLLQEAFARLEQDYIDAWKISPARDTDGRE